MIDYIRDVVAREVKKSEVLKHIPGTVVRIVDNTYNGKAVVNVMGRTLTLINKTGEILAQGDGVIIHYWDNVANGYIALRCGLPNPAGGLNIENAVVGYESIAKLNNISKSVEKVYSENKYKTTYGTALNTFYLNGYPAFLTKYASLYRAGSIPNEYWNGIKSELGTFGGFSQQATLIVGREDARYPAQETFYTHISYSSNMMGDWIHRVGLYSATDDTYYKGSNDDVYFRGIPSGAGIAIVCNRICTLKANEYQSQNYPYGYARGFLVVKCPNGYTYNNGVETSTDLFFYDGEYKFAFTSNDEREYAMNVIAKNYVVPSTYE